MLKKYNHSGQVDHAVFGEIFNSLDTAVLYYNGRGELSAANSTAVEILPDLNRALSVFSDFLAFIYDHSLDFKDQHGLNPETKVHRAAAFYEIVKLPDGNFYQVRTIEQKDRSMIVELLDISQIKINTDNLLALDENNKILTEAIQTSQKGVFIAEWDGAHRIIFANKVLDKVIGRQGAPLVNYNVNAFLSAQFPDEWDKIEKTINGGDKGSFWKKIDEGNGTYRWIVLNLSAQSTCGNRRLIIGFISDETQSKLQENQLRQTQKLEAIGKLAGGVAHDFNNILSIIDGYIFLSEAALKRKEDISQNLGRIKQAVARGSGLTQQLLMFGKHRVTDNKVIDLCSQVKEMETLLRPLLGINIRLIIDVPDDIIPVKTTADTISQIVMNLAINARDSMPAGGNIIISVYEESEEGISKAILKVIDDGAGMAPDIMDRIFDPFFTTKEQGKGTGLGLSMVYGLVQQMGATINVSSSVGQGTSFIISIPVAEDKNNDVTQSLASIAGDGVSGKTILIAEDEPDLLEIMSQTLKGFDMKVLTARNGNEALVVQDEYEDKIDFLLTDMVMPELGGLKLAELMKEVRPETHIVFMSGYPVRGEIASVELPQEAVFMAKPIKSDYLRSVLEQVANGQSIDNIKATLWRS